MSDEPVRRRDWLVTAAFAMAGVGGAMAMWPFVAALGPDAETLARRSIFALSDLKGLEPKTISIDNLPITIFRRTEADLAWLQNPPFGPRRVGQATGYAFHDAESSASRQPAWARNWHRSLRPEIMVCVATCARGDCIVQRSIVTGRIVDTFQCPCCGARYDLSGRVFSGPARENLRVPPYRFIGPGTIEFLDAEVLSKQA
jgi:ubiquinol-cytochrome c reductase iron-sulfur subunit